MTFLSPLFWLGAVAVIGPILLHLVQKEKKERIPFASLMLMPRLPVKQTRRRRLKHLFLLLLRCLGLLLLVGAFARPVATGAWFDRINPLTARSVVVLLDNSLSMSRAEVWSRAVTAAETEIRSLGEGDEGRLVVFGEAGEVVSPWESQPVRLTEALKGLRPSYESTSYVEGLRRAVEQFEGERNPRKVIYWITDLQRGGLTATEGWKVPEGIEVQIEDVGQDSSNLYIEEARLDREVFGKDYPLPVLVRLGQSPPAPVKGTARLFVEGKLVDAQSFETGEQGGGQLTFKPFPLEEGVSRGKIVVEPADSLPDDNVFHFVVERKQPRRALVVARRNESAFYLQSALQAGENLPFRVEAVRSLPGALEVDETPLVILDDLDQWPSLERVKAYVEAGGGLIAVLAANTRAPDAAWSEFLPGRPVERRFVRSSGKPFTALTEVGWEHPVFRVFQEQQRSAVASAQFYGYWLVQPNPGSSALARFDGGDPALLEVRRGAGRVVVFASSLDSSWTDFPLRSAYLPFWFRLVQHTAGWEAKPAALRVNQSIRPGGGSAEAGSWDVLDPTGKRILGLDERDPGAIRLQTPGHYEIRENKATDWVAVNVPPLESDLGRIPVEDLQAVFVPGQSRVESSDGASATVASREKTQSLWWLFLLAAGAVLSIESVVANRAKLRE